jgi:homoserine O-acetyltransferase/O-succinyltransferase
LATTRTNPCASHRHVLELFREQPLRLESGDTLGPVTIAFESWGQPNASRSNGVLLLHGFSGDSHAAGPAGPGHPTGGWWDGLIGPGRAIDTDRYFVVCPNVLGGCQGSTGPGSQAPDGRPWGSRFPALTIRDQVEAEVDFSDWLQVQRWQAVIGGSMGGMRAMEWAIGHPGRLERLVLLATTARCSAQTNAFHHGQIEAIRQDPAFLGGDFYDHPGGGPRAGLARARTIARRTYGGIEDGDGFLDRFDANSYLVLTQAMAGHDVGRGRGGVAAALAGISAPTHVVSVNSDRLFPPHSQRELARGIAGPVHFTAIDSHHGHDGFLAEQGQLASVLRPSLA